MSNRLSIRDRKQRKRWGEEDNSPSPKYDLEMFGKMVRYSSVISENMLCNYFKDTTYSNLLWETMATTVVNTANAQNPLPSMNEYVTFLEEGLEALKHNAETGLTTVESRVIVTDINPADDSIEHTRLNSICSDNEIMLNNFLLHTVEQTDEVKSLLTRMQQLNQGYFDIITTIRKTIIDNLIVID